MKKPTEKEPEHAESMGKVEREREKERERKREREREKRE